MSLIVATKGRASPFGDLFASLETQDFRDFEVVVVDQNADDRVGTPEAEGWRFPVVHLHTPHESGASRGRNAGFAGARGSVVLFPDDDCWYPADLVRAVVEAFAAAPDLAAVTGRTVDADGRESLGLYLRADARIGKRNVWSIGNSNSLFVRRGAARVVGGFDESLGVGSRTPFKSGEETDFLLRILAQGGEARYRRDMIVHHDQIAEADGATLARRAAAYSRGFGRVLRLHRYGVGYLGLRLCRTLVGACLASARRDAAGVRYKLLWAWGTVRGYADRTPPVLHGPAPSGAAPVRDRRSTSAVP